MQMIHQIWVSWVEKPENALFIPHHFEWNTNNITVYENIPIFRVSDAMFDIFLNRNGFSVPSPFLQHSLNKAYYVDGNSRELSNHCFIIVNSTFNALAVHTNGTTYSILKSRLLYRHEIIVKNIIVTSGLEETVIEEKVLSKLTYDPIDFIYTSSFYIGLNYSEIQQKRKLLLTLRQLKEDKKRDALAFLLSEFGSHAYINVLSLEVDKVYLSLLNLLKNGWTEKHQIISTYTQKWFH